ncbi:uncharacterized protein LOC112673328 [Canis lupus dingo]|uniref:uncharacterized protein LOC112673328 n=1 Tax=Canis lupus dingo TaxID=286419 RepID=UPI000DC6AB6F|nr:uncharacterized protein LOC112673328 [Canis lupus dingo]
MLRLFCIFEASAARRGDPAACGPLRPPGRLPPHLGSPSRPPAAPGCGAPTPRKYLSAPPPPPRPARPSAPQPSRSRRLAAAPGLALFPSASHSTPSPATAPPLSPLTARRHFPRSSALNRKLAAQPAAAATAAAAATDSAAAAAAVAVEGLRRQRLEPRAGASGICSPEATPSTTGPRGPCAAGLAGREGVVVPVVVLAVVMRRTLRPLSSAPLPGSCGGRRRTIVQALALPLILSHLLSPRDI